MAKKNKDDIPNPNSIPNRDIIQRLNFLYQASTYLNGLAEAHTQTVPPDVSARPTKGNGNGKQQEGCDEVQEGEARAGDDAVKNAENSRKRPARRKATARDLSRSYVKSMKIIGQKTNVKMDPSVKRTLCKGCNGILMPGVTAKVRVKPLPSHGHAVNYTCMNCSISRRVPAPPTVGQSCKISPSHSDQRYVSNSDAMNVDPTCQQVDALPNVLLTEEPMEDGKDLKELPRRRQTRRRKGPIQPRPMPFFAREGHILYIGNDRVVEKHEGDAK
ncbi:hypothetical protein M0805_006393 [Coniferiporia weirii]|nr:hypothetical protein M0805_006393 [Coniferiporia weirii]